MAVDRQWALQAGCSVMRLAVVIATRNRRALLVERALASVWRQTLRPDLVVVVDDGDDEEWSLEGVRLVRNRRQQGVCGAWNSGLDKVVEWCGEENPWVAFLDDDDAWRPTYLESSVRRGVASEVDMVAADLAWWSAPGEHLVDTPAPDVLQTEDFLVGNPGIQGSNLFVRIRSLERVGGFDESLVSCSDRDLVLRLIGDGVRYARHPEVLVDHFAEATRLRLSTPGSDANRAGLRRFHLLWQHRMSASIELAFLERAQRLFCCDVGGPDQAFKRLGAWVGRAWVSSSALGELSSRQDTLHLRAPSGQVLYTHEEPAEPPPSAERLMRQWFSGLAGGDGVIDELRSHLRELTGRELIPFQDVLLEKGQAHEGFPWHQDAPFWPIDYSTGLITWVALTLSDESRGGVGVVPGSHLDVRERAVDLHTGTLQGGGVLRWRGGTVFPELSAGDVLVFDALTVHGSSANVSGELRAGWAISWVDSEATWDHKAVPRHPAVSRTRHGQEVLLWSRRRYPMLG